MFKSKFMFCVCFRCVSVCGADMLCRALVHVYVYCDSRLPVSAKEEAFKRYKLFLFFLTSLQVNVCDDELRCYDKESCPCSLKFKVP